MRAVEGQSRLLLAQMHRWRLVGILLQLLLLLVGWHPVEGAAAVAVAGLQRVGTRVGSRDDGYYSIFVCPYINTV